MAGINDLKAAADALTTAVASLETAIANVKPGLSASDQAALDSALQEVTSATSQLGTETQNLTGAGAAPVTTPPAGTPPATG